MSDRPPEPLPDWLLGASYPWQDERAILLYQLLTKNVPLPSSILPLAQMAGIDLSAVRESRGRDTWADVLDAAVGSEVTLRALWSAFEGKVKAAVPSLTAILAMPPPDAAHPAPRLAPSETELTTREQIRSLLVKNGRAIIAYYTDHPSFKSAADVVATSQGDGTTPVAWVLLPENNDPKTALPEEGSCVIEYQNGNIVRRVAL